MSASRTGGYRSLFTVAEYRPVFVSHVISMLGTVVSEVALSLLVFRATGSPFLTAATFAVGFVPYALGGTVLAAVADRYPSRTVLFVCNLATAVAVAAMTVPVMPIVALLVLRFLTATIAPIFGAARAASIPDIVPGDAAILARSLVRIVSQASQIVGFAVGGLLLTVVAPRAALGGEAVAFLVSALLLRFGTRWRPARAADTGRSMLGDSLRGLRELFADRRLRALMLLWWVPPAFSVVPEALAAPYTHGVGAGSVGLGLFMTAGPAGAVAGSLLIGLLPAPARARPVAALAGCSLLPFAVFVVRPGIPVALVLMFVAGLCTAYMVGLDQWFLAAIPDELGGRAMAANGAGLMLVQGVGMAAGGAVAEAVAPALVITVAGVVGTAATLLALLAVRRTAPVALPARA